MDGPESARTMYGVIVSEAEIPHGLSGFGCFWKVIYSVLLLSFQRNRV